MSLVGVAGVVLQHRLKVDRHRDVLGVLGQLIVASKLLSRSILILFRSVLHRLQVGSLLLADPHVLEKILGHDLGHALHGYTYPNRSLSEIWKCNKNLKCNTNV